MRSDVLTQIRWLIPFDAATFFLSRADEDQIGSPINLNFDGEYLEKYIKDYNRYDYARGLKISAGSTVYRETDLFSEDVWLQSDYYKEICAPLRIRYIIHCSIVYRHRFVGLLSLYRKNSTINSVDFSSRDAYILNILKKHFAIAVGSALTGSHGEPEPAPGSKVAERYSLTPKEAEVYGLVRQGLDTVEICEMLLISPHTLKKHFTSIYNKTGTANRTQLIRLTLR
jgi:DNA-binding CsgD family transcriptional regulator